MKTLSVNADRFEMAVMYWYHTREYSIREVAKELDCQPNKVREILHKYKPGPRPIEEALELRSTDEYREKLRLQQLGNRNYQAKLTEQEVVAIRHQYENLLKSNLKIESQQLLAKKYGVKRPTISDIVLRRTWKHI